MYGKPPTDFSEFRILCAECNRHFRSQACFMCHKQNNSKEKSVFEHRLNCATRGNNECNMHYCKIFNQNRNIGYLCFMIPLKGVLSDKANNVLYVFYDFETTQNKRHSETAKHMCRISCACDSFVRGVSSRKMLI